MASNVRRPLLVSATAGAFLFVAWLSMSHEVPAPPQPVACDTAKATPEAGADPSPDEFPAFQFRIPSGNTSEVSCADMHSIIEQVDSTLAYEPDDVDARELVDATLDWIDPHGLWAIAEDAPLGDFLTTRAKTLKSSLHTESCAFSDEAGGVVEGWSRSLEAAFDAARQGASASEADSAASDALPNNVKARSLAEELGRRMGALERRHGAALSSYVKAAREHFFPELSRERWGNVVRAALVRAYVPLVDPHGAWAPLDEEASLYEVDLAANAPHAMFGHIVPTVIGARVESVGAPFEEGDVVLDLANVTLAGLPLEQLDQLSFALDEEAEWTSHVLRHGALVTLHGTAHHDAGPSPADEGAKVETARVPYGEGEVLVIGVHDVRDDLGRDVAALVRDTHRKGANAPLGIVIDLRGNGGGSTDGAAEALGAFLPGVPLFPMKRRDGTVEVERAPEPDPNERWVGPVAAIVDNGTASAAEMISGALLAYERGVVVGAPTFGKGCAQEYVDDDARTGVLRLTTLVYSLPDGQPVQRVGLQPLIRLTFDAKNQLGPNEREAKLAHSAKAWRGPDVRDPGHKTWTTPWPSPQGNVGPCADEDLCRALRAIAPTPSRHAPVAKGH